MIGPILVIKIDIYIYIYIFLRRTSILPPIRPLLLLTRPVTTLTMSNILLHSLHMPCSVLVIPVDPMSRAMYPHIVWPTYGLVITRDIQPNAGPAESLDTCQYTPKQPKTKYPSGVQFPKCICINEFSWLWYFDMDNLWSVIHATCPLMFNLQILLGKWHIPTYLGYRQWCRYIHTKWSWSSPSNMVLIHFEVDVFARAWPVHHPQSVWITEWAMWCFNMENAIAILWYARITEDTG